MNLEEIQIKKDTNNLPWVEIYRPQSLEDLISHNEIVSTVKKFVSENRLPNLLFYGPPGTGKTSTIKALAKEIYGDQYSGQVLELNASDERGINVVRDQIKTFVSTTGINFAFQKNQGPKKPKLVILDEADNMIHVAQFALRRLMEKYSSNARFCLICNYVSKIIPALQSRCTRFKFKNLEYEAAKPRIQQICDEQNMNYNENGLSSVFKLCEGDLRRVVNLLQAIKLSIDNQKDTLLDENYVYSFTGNITPKEIESIFEVLLTQELKNAFKIIRDMQIEKGLSLQVLIKELNLVVMDYKIQTQCKAFLVQRLSEIEYRLSIDSNEKVQLMSLIGAFIEIRHTIN